MTKLIITYLYRFICITLCLMHDMLYVLRAYRREKKSVLQIGDLVVLSNTTSLSLRSFAEHCGLSMTSLGIIVEIINDKSEFGNYRKYGILWSEDHVLKNMPFKNIKLSENQLTRVDFNKNV